VLVTGATGRTGSLLYKRLVADGTFTVRAFVRDISKARKYLGCTKCDASEGIYEGNVSDSAALQVASRGATAVAIAVGVGGNATAKEMAAVEWHGVEKQVAALAQPANLAAVGGQPAGLRVVLCSSMGTTAPDPSPMEGGGVLFWKLNAEAFLLSSGLSVAIIKPGGLVDIPGSKTLLVGKDDALLGTKPPVVARDDVARVMLAALLHETKVMPLDLRLDLCSKQGPATTDLDALLESSKYPWQR